MKFRLSVAIATILASDDSSVYARNYIRFRHANRSLSSGKGSMDTTLSKGSADGTKGKGSTSKAPSAPSKGKGSIAEAAAYVVLSDECIDNEDYEFLSWNGDVVGCWWITEHESTTVHRQEHHCSDEEFAANCCAACLN